MSIQKSCTYVINVMYMWLIKQGQYLIANEKIFLYKKSINQNIQTVSFLTQSHTSYIERLLMNYVTRDMNPF